MRILIADDHEIMRRGVRSLLAAATPWEVCGEAVDGRDAVNKAGQLRPDVIVMDVSMPSMNGLEAARTIRRSFPEIEILMLTQHESEEMIRQAFKAGAKGYVSKSAISQNLVSAVQAVARHEFFSADNAPSQSERPNAATRQILQREASLEQALRESEERFRSTFEQVAVGMAHVTLKGHFLRMNQKLSEILGYRRAIPGNIHFRDVTHPDDVVRSEEEFAALISGAKPDFSIVKRYIHHQNGSVIWANTTSNLVRDSHGTPSYVVTVVEDITATIRSQSELNSSIAETVVRLELAQCALREKDEQLRVALAASGTGAFRWDPQTGELLEFGESARRLFGFAPGEAVSSIAQLTSRMDPDDLSTVASAMERCRTGADLEFENRVVLSDGTTRWLYARGKTTLDSKGRPCVVGALTDITKRKRTEEALRRSVYRFHRFVESNVIGIAIADTNGIVEANDVFLHIVGFARHDLAAGKVRWAEMTPLEFRERDAQAVAELQSLGSCSPFEREFIRKDGSRVPTLVGATVLDLSPLQWMFFVLDLSELKRVETELREARDELEDRVELRTRELVRTLSNLEAQVKVRKEAEEKMRSLSARLLHLQDDERRRIARDLHDTCGQTLSAIKMTSDALKRTLDLKPAGRRLFDDLDALTEQALEEVRATSHLLHPPLLDEIGFLSAARWLVDGLMARSRMEIDLDVRMCERIPAPLELVLFRVLQECLTNIHRHSGSPRASIRCEQASGEVILTVRDYGCGMPAGVLERFRCTGVAAGVGLAGMQERVRELNGQMEIDSGAGGTVVTVTIPVPAAEPAEKSQAAETHSGGTLN